MEDATPVHPTRQEWLDARRQQMVSETRRIRQQEERSSRWDSVSSLLQCRHAAAGLIPAALHHFLTEVRGAPASFTGADLVRRMRALADDMEEQYRLSRYGPLDAARRVWRATLETVPAQLGLPEVQELVFQLLRPHDEARALEAEARERFARLYAAAPKPRQAGEAPQGRGGGRQSGSKPPRGRRPNDQLVCTKCGKQGHPADKCRVQPCRICGVTGHAAHACPKAPSA